MHLVLYEMARMVECEVHGTKHLHYCTLAVRVTSISPDRLAAADDVVDEWCKREWGEEDAMEGEGYVRIGAAAIHRNVNLLRASGIEVVGFC